MRAISMTSLFFDEISKICKKMSPKLSKFHKKLLKTEYRKILRLFVADIMEFPEKIYLEKLQSNFQDHSNLQTRICWQK